jgi:tRNA(Arg) A34 adenosine deaminase TadA
VLEIEEHMEPHPKSVNDLSKKQRNFIDLASRIAQQTDFKEYKHGAILVRAGAVLNTSCNKNKYKAWANRFRDANKQRGHATVHAEIGVILGLDRSITEGAIIYVVRVGRDGHLRNSKPCPMCEAAMQFVGIKRVIYSNEHGRIEHMRIYNE